MFVFQDGTDPLGVGGLVGRHHQVDKLFLVLVFLEPTKPQEVVPAFTFGYKLHLAFVQDMHQHIQFVHFRRGDHQWGYGRSGTELVDDGQCLIPVALAFHYQGFSLHQHDFCHPVQDKIGVFGVTHVVPVGYVRAFVFPNKVVG